MAKQAEPTPETTGPRPWYDAYSGTWGGSWPKTAKDVDFKSAKVIRRILDFVRTLHKAQSKLYTDGLNSYQQTVFRNRREFIAMLETLLEGAPRTKEQDHLEI